MLTGASGFLGCFVLQELLRDNPQMRVRALVRSAAKLRSDAAMYQVMVDWDRVAIVEGDLSQELFGLSSSEFDALGNSTDCIIHNGCAVNGVYPYSLLRDTNVGGKKERGQNGQDLSHDRLLLFIYYYFFFFAFFFKERLKRFACQLRQMQI